MIDFIIPVFVGIVLGVMILQVINIYQAWREFNETDHEVEEFVDKMVKQKLIILDVEAVDEQFICYNSLTKEFVCMGQNMTEVQERFRQRYPDKEAALIKEDPVAQQLKATV
jgi:Na+/phosphate symporter